MRSTTRLVTNSRLLETTRLLMNLMKTTRLVQLLQTTRVMKPEMRLE